jgi:polynucleotide 5'-hydroxyl-kinase GRC3/NOL9
MNILEGGDREGAMEAVTGRVMRDPMPHDLLAEVTAARKTMVIGASDTGKTTLIVALANELVRRERNCSVIDADMGQSDIGPPTAIGLGVVSRQIEELGEAELKGMYFVGAISPRGFLLPAVVGTGKMVRKAEALCYDHILINTSGLVRGPLGRALKGAKLDLVCPDLVIFLQVQAECEPLIRRVSRLSRCRSIVLAPSEQVTTKSPVERKGNRAQSLRSYFSGSTTYSVSLSELYLEDFPFFTGRFLSLAECNCLSELLGERVLWAEEQDEEIRVLTGEGVRRECVPLVAACAPGSILYAHCPDEFENILVGLYDHVGECYSLGIVRRIDFSTQHAEVEIAQPCEKPWGIKFSLCKIDSEGNGTMLARATALGHTPR